MWQHVFVSCFSLVDLETLPFKFEIGPFKSGAIATIVVTRTEPHIKCLVSSLLATSTQSFIHIGPAIFQKIMIVQRYHGNHIRCPARISL